MVVIIILVFIQSPIVHVHFYENFCFYISLNMGATLTEWKTTTLTHSIWNMDDCQKRIPFCSHKSLSFAIKCLLSFDHIQLRDYGSLFISFVIYHHTPWWNAIVMYCVSKKQGNGFLFRWFERNRWIRRYMESFTVIAIEGLYRYQIYVR